MAKKKIDPLTEKEKEDQRLVIPFDKSKQFVTNLIALFDSSTLFKEWEINHKSINLKGTSLKMHFVIKDTAIDKEIENLDTAQKKIKQFIDPDKVPDEPIEEEPVKI